MIVGFGLFRKHESVAPHPDMEYKVSKRAYWGSIILQSGNNDSIKNS